MKRRTVLIGLGVAALTVGCAPPDKPVPVPSARPPEPAKADRVLVMKGARQMYLLAGGRKLRSYTISLGRVPVGHKRHEGDGKTPEGQYTLQWINEESAFHRSIHINYPGPADLEYARSKGLDPGGEIKIHGLPNGKGWIGADHARYDWTEGCIAVTNEEMDEILAMVDYGTPIEIRP